MSPVGKQLQSYMREAAKAIGTGSGGDGSREGAMSRGSKTMFLRDNGETGVGVRAGRGIADGRHFLLAVHVRVGDTHAFETINAGKLDRRLKKGGPSDFPWDDYFLCVQRVAVLSLADAGLANRQSTSDLPALLPFVRLSWYIATDWSPEGVTTSTPLWKAAERVFGGGMYNSTLLAPAAGGALHTSAHSHPTPLSFAEFRFGVQRVLLEHSILSRADYVFHAHSTFSETAADISLTNSISVALTERIGQAGMCKP
eukprot:2424618-Pleurochrysis_carterae.AAC.1